MLISNRHKFIFFHVPKVAGSSVTKALRRYSNIPYERLYNYMIDFFGERPALSIYDMHISPSRMKETIKNRAFFDEAFKFAFVRNTWDWHVSQYHFHKQNEKYGVWHSVFKDKNFEEYVRWAVIPENIENTLSAQKRFLSDSDGNVMMDFVGRFEKLEEDFNEISSRLNLPARLPKANKSKREKSYQKYYTDETRDLIGEAFRDDIEHFGFEF